MISVAALLQAKIAPGTASNFKCSPNMTGAINDPAYWRQRADEARRLSEQLTDPVAKDALQQVAASYEQLATLVAQRPIQKV